MHYALARSLPHPPVSSVQGSRKAKRPTSLVMARGGARSWTELSGRPRALAAFFRWSVERAPRFLQPLPAFRPWLRALVGLPAKLSLASQISMRTADKDLNGLILATSVCGAISCSFSSDPWCDSGS